MLFSERSGSPQGTERDFLSGAFDFQHISRGQLELIAQGLGKDDAAGFVQSEGTIHNSIMNWEMPFVNGILNSPATKERNLELARWLVCRNGRRPRFFVCRGFGWRVAVDE